MLEIKVNTMHESWCMRLDLHYAEEVAAIHGIDDIDFEVRRPNFVMHPCYNGAFGWIIESKNQQFLLNLKNTLERTRTLMLHANSLPEGLKRDTLRDLVFLQLRIWEVYRSKEAAATENRVTIFWMLAENHPDPIVKKIATNPQERETFYKDVVKSLWWRKQAKEDGNQSFVESLIRTGVFAAALSALNVTAEIHEPVSRKPQSLVDLTGPIDMKSFGKELSSWQEDVEAENARHDKAVMELKLRQQRLLEVRSSLFGKVEETVIR